MVAANFTIENGTIPSFLVREIIGGQKFYYRGYKAVLSKEKTFEAIAYSSILQAVLATYLSMQIVKGKLDNRYTVLCGNPGLAIDSNNHLVCTALLFEPTIFTYEKISTSYADVAPELALLIDDKVDVDSHCYLSYIRKKVDALLSFGAAKVIWILTVSRLVIVAVPNLPWLTYDWNESIELLDGVTFNIGQYLSKKGASLPE